MADAKKKAVQGGEAKKPKAGKPNARKKAMGKQMQKPGKPTPEPEKGKIGAKKPPVKPKTPAKPKAPVKPAKKAAPRGKVTAKPKTAPMPRTPVKGKGKEREKAPGGVKAVEKPDRKKSGLSVDDLDYFKRVLNEKRSRIIEKARDTLNEGMKLDESDLPDEYDMASSEYLQYFTLRLRGRERYFLEKIERALQRIEESMFGTCEICGEEIGMARLMARPETTLCIRCKETQEREERQFNE